MKGVQHLEAVRLRVREQKELLTGANKELRRLKKTLKTFEVHGSIPLQFPWPPHKDSCHTVSLLAFGIIARLCCTFALKS